MGASAELKAVADEVVQVVNVMDGLNRYRFMNDAELLAAWESASNVLAAPRSRHEATRPTPDPVPRPPGGDSARPREAGPGKAAEESRAAADSRDCRRRF